MAWRLAKSLDVLRSQINEAYPNRSKSSDGTIGDEKHASRSSDHNPWVKDGKTGVVTAIDFTHDPEQGVDAGALAEALRLSRDSRIKYIISNRRIANSSKTGGAEAWAWRRYTGSNPHTKHMHLSVKSTKASYDDTRPWKLDVAQKPAPKPVAKPPVVAESDGEVRGDAAVWHVQRRLKAMKYNPGGLDGIWGGMTGGAISGFINDRQLKIAAPTSFEMFQKTLPALRDEMAKAEAEIPSFTRPIAPERADVTPADLAEKLPEVQKSITAERLGFWASIGTAVSAAVTGIAKFIGDAIEMLNPLKEFISDLPWPVWVGGALAVSGALYYISRVSGQAKDAATQAYQEGSRV